MVALIAAMAPAREHHFRLTVCLGSGHSSGLHLAFPPLNSPYSPWKGTDVGKLFHLYILELEK